MPNLNRKDALARLGGNEEMYNRLIETLRRKFSKISKNNFEDMNSNGEKFYILIHSLKNLSASLGAENLEEASSDLENELNHGGEGSVKELFDSCIDKLEVLFEEIGREDLSDDTPFHRKEIDKNETVELLAEIRGCVESYSPGEARKAVRSIIQHKWPSSISMNIERIGELLKEYDFMESEEILNKIEKELG